VTARVTTELATADNFDLERYLACNADVAAHVAKGGDARQHLLDHGIGEGRRQLRRDVWEEARAISGDRYRAFLPLLDPVAPLRFARAGNAFPLLDGNVDGDTAPFAHETARAAPAAFLAEARANPDLHYVEIGCGRRTSTLANCLYVDTYAAASADLVVADPAALPLRSAAFDGIGCFDFLQRVARPWAVAAELRRILKPGGRLWIEWPFLRPASHPEEHYHATSTGVSALFDEGFVIETTGAPDHLAPPYAIVAVLDALLTDLARQDAALHDRLLGMSLRDLVLEPRAGTFWRDIAGKLSPRAAKALAGGTLLVARKA
jgi:SAM-dependent methyltransferase